MRNVDRLGENKMGLNIFERRILKKVLRWGGGWSLPEEI
jgi:hypothetical protein